MNITPSTVYWVAQCDCIREACIPIIIFGIILSIISIGLTVIAYCDEVSDMFGSRWIVATVSFVVLAVTIVGVLGRIFVPTTKTVAAMYIIPAVANNEKVQDCGNRLYDLAIEWMDELKPAKKEEN